MELPVMEQVRQHLEDGRSSRELIAKGFKPSTVYKVQRYWRSEAMVKETGDDEELDWSQEIPAEPLPASCGPEPVEVEEAAEEPEVDDLRLQVVEYAARIDELEAEVYRTEALEERIAELQEALEGTETLRHGNQELEHRLHHAVAERDNVFGLAAYWRQRVGTLEQERNEVTAEAREAKRQAQRLESQNAEGGQRVTLAKQAVVKLAAEIEQLKPLRQVWSGHPCSKCQRPMSGMVSRETAAILLQEFAHIECLRDDGPKLGSWLLGGAMLYGLSKRR